MQAQAAELQLTDVVCLSAEIAEMAAAVPVLLPLMERQGCGWFESSYELGSGLEVIEQSDDCLYQLWSQLADGRCLH